MFFILKKSNLLQKQSALYALFFCVFFSLFSTTTFATTYKEEEFAKLENQLKEKVIKPDDFLMSVIQTSPETYNYEKKVFIIDDDLVKRRNELVQLGLDYGANANHFLEKIISQ